MKILLNAEWSFFCELTPVEALVLMRSNEKT